MARLLPLSDILDYQVDTEESFKLYHTNVNPAYPARFFGYSIAEVRSELAARLDETERRSSLVALARLEAAFRVDYKARAASKKSDDLSICIRRIYSEKSDRARLSEDILEAWRDNLDPEGRSKISQLRGMLKYRHWLAHGRYWQNGSR